MSVIVRGMEMPSDCKNCPFEVYQTSTMQSWCVAKMGILMMCGKRVKPGYKPKWCPLFEVKAWEEI